MYSLLLFVPILMWSFVGLLVKSATGMFDPSAVSFARFFFGVVALALYFLLVRRKPAWDFLHRWIWLGAAAKAGNYITENIAIKIGHNWGNILVQPVQAVTLVIIASFILKEKTGPLKMLAVVLSVAGVLLVSWGGQDISSLMSGGLVIPLLFVVSGICAALHLYSQKKLVGGMPSLPAEHTMETAPSDGETASERTSDASTTKPKHTMDSGSMNLNMFIVASAMTALPLPFSSSLQTGPTSTMAIIAMVILGCITGISFLIWGALLQRVPFMVSGLMANATALFTLLWSHLLSSDPIGPWVIAGTVIFIAGLLILNLPEHPQTKQTPER